ncbi:MAG: SPOR domain-containing protein [Bacteroides sp.]|nr:SPOR domain-containing protein [Bacteroides sp.]
MKKLALLGLGMCVALAFSSCKSSQESAYKKAYEKAQQRETAEAQSQEVTVAPSQEAAPVTAAAPVGAKVVESAPANVHQEKVTVVSGGNGTLNDYSVVCGSFKFQDGAERRKADLDSKGYNAIVVYNSEKATYRVIVSTHADYATAAQARDAFKAKYANVEEYQGAWLLYSVK